MPQINESLAILKTWFEEAKASGASQMTIVTDTFGDPEQYPVYSIPGSPPEPI